MKRSLIFMLALVCIGNASDCLEAQWLEAHSGGATSGSLTDVIMVDSVTAFAVGRGGEILRSKDAGATWIDLGAMLSYGERWNGISFADTAHIAVVGDRGVVLTTENGGKGWTWHQLPNARTAFSVMHEDSNVIYVGADSGWIYYTTNTGQTWSSEKVSRFPIRSIFPARGLLLTFYAPPIYALTPHSFLMNGGAGWFETILQPFQGLGSEAYDGEFSYWGRSAFIVGVQGDLRAAPAIIRQQKSDPDWKNFTSGIHSGGVLHGLSSPADYIIYVCGTHGMLYKSFDEGLTWSLQAVPTTKNLNAIYFFNKDRGIAVGDSGVILRTTNGGGVSQRLPDEKVIPSTFRLEHNYPNPFNPQTRIVYEIAERTTVRIDIVDVLGRYITTLTDRNQDAGRYSIQWDGKNSAGASVSSGVYICRMLAGRSYAASITLLLMR